jgi:hypothetical protein
VNVAGERLGQGGSRGYTQEGRGCEQHRGGLCALTSAALQQPGKLKPLQALGSAAFTAAESQWGGGAKVGQGPDKRAAGTAAGAAGAAANGQGRGADTNAPYEDAAEHSFCVHCALASVSVNEAVAAMLDTDGSASGSAGDSAAEKPDLKEARYMAGHCRMLLGHYDLAAAHFAKAAAQ